jgi:hypothetical protein
MSRHGLLAFAVIATVGMSTHALAAGPAQRATAAKITRSGVDGVRIGATFASLRRAGLVGRTIEGCPVDGVRSATLRAPLRGFVDLSNAHPRRVTDVFVRGGGKARGVGQGSTLRAIRRAFPRARTMRAPVFGARLVRVPRNGGGPLEFVLDSRTRKVTGIGVPFVPFCD